MMIVNTAGNQIETMKGEKTFEEFRLNMAIQSRTIEKKVNEEMKKINAHQNMIASIFALQVMTFAITLIIFITQ